MKHSINYGLFIWYNNHLWNFRVAQPHDQLFFHKIRQPPKSH